MDHVIAARAQMGTSLAFHIVFAALGIGLPALLIVVEGMWLRTNDRAYYRLARTWSAAMAVLFAVGAVSGTVLSFELGLLWPEFMKRAGGIIGIPFSAEGFAFFIEAIFVGLYLYGWKKLSPRVHWLCGFPIAVSGALSALFVVCANAWMNTPAGFQIVNGAVVNVDPWAAMFNPAWKTEALHTVLSAYVFTGFGVAALYALAIARGNRAPHILAGLRIAMLVGAIAIPLQIVAGDMSSRFDAYNEPVKFAAQEGQYPTEAGAPLRIGGIADDTNRRTPFALEIPGGASWLAFGDTKAIVRGLNAFPRDETPLALPVHLSFQAMVGIGFGLLALALWWFFATRRGRPPSLALARAITVAGPLSLVAMECGWFVTELGRQPWIVHGYLKTTDAVTIAPNLDVAFYGFSALYVVLGAAAWWLVLRIAKLAPYGGEAKP
jgi:cytochrome d ubiquinol oxidase subunit I